MGPMEIVGVLLVIVFVATLTVMPSVVGYRLGLKRDHEVVGLLLGLFLSWLGVLIVVLLPKQKPAIV